jgi:hypothetical protein
MTKTVDGQPSATSAPPATRRRRRPRLEWSLPRLEVVLNPGVYGCEHDTEECSCETPAEASGRWGANRATRYMLAWPRCSDDSYLDGVLDKRIVETTFALGPAQFLVAESLRHRATSAYHDPVWRQATDTAQRDEIYSLLVVGAVQAYFYWLTEHVEDPADSKDPWWLDWHRFAQLRFWWGRTGSGLYERFARMKRTFYWDDPNAEPNPKNPSQRLLGEGSWQSYLEARYPATAAGRQAWQEDAWGVPPLGSPPPGNAQSLIP